MRDEPGIGAFAVTLNLATGPGLRVLSQAEIERLRASKKIIGDRTRAIVELRTTMPPPEMHVAPE